MTLAIIGLITAIAPFAVRWVYRRWARKDDPLEQHRVRYQQISRDIISQASERATVNATADLDELERRVRHKGVGNTGG